MNKIRQYIVPVIFLFFLTACSERSVSYELYMGMSKPDGGVVSAEEWRQFLNEEVTPLFPDGLSVLDAYGQYLYRGASEPTSENSKVLVIMGREGTEIDRKINRVVEAYKSQFDQESVLVVEKEIALSFR